MTPVLHHVNGTFCSRIRLMRKGARATPAELRYYVHTTPTIHYPHHPQQGAYLDEILNRRLSLSIELHIQDKIGLILAVWIAVDVLESLELPQCRRWWWYRSQAFFVLTFFLWNAQTKE